METVLAILFVCIGFGLFVNAFSAALNSRMVYRIGSAGCGILAMEVGALRYAAARGVAWATPELRQTAFAWVVGLFTVSLVIGWIIQHRVERKAHDRNS